MKTKFRSNFKPQALGTGFARCFLALLCVGAEVQAGSLWRESVTDERGMFADKRARRVGDILTVVCQNDRIIFRSANTFTQTRSLEGQSPGLASRFLNQLIGGVTSEASHRLVSGGSANAAGSRSFPGNLVPRGPNVPSYLGAPTDFASGNQNTDDQTQNFTVSEANIAVQVIDVLPNGNLIVEGIREMAMQERRGRLYIRGIIRAMDLNAINAVPSTQVADLRLEFQPDGANGRTAQKGWLQKVDEKITPW